MSVSFILQRTLYCSTAIHGHCQVQCLHVTNMTQRDLGKWKKKRRIRMNLSNSHSSEKCRKRGSERRQRKQLGQELAGLWEISSACFPPLGLPPLHLCCLRCLQNLYIHRLSKIQEGTVGRVRGWRDKVTERGVGGGATGRLNNRLFLKLAVSMKLK